MGSTREGWELGSTGAALVFRGFKEKGILGPAWDRVNSSLSSVHRKLIPADPWESLLEKCAAIEVYPHSTQKRSDYLWPGVKGIYLTKNNFPTGF